MNIKKIVICGVLGVIALLGDNTHAAEVGWDGRSLLLYCDPDPMTSPEAAAPLDGYCIGYLHGIMDMKAEATAVSKQSFSSCTPDGMTRQTARQVVVAYIKSHPERVKLPASTLVLSALAESFPCPDPKKKGDKPK